MICFKKSKMKKLVAVIKLIAAEHPYTAKLSKPTKQLNIINPQPETVQKYKLKDYRVKSNWMLPKIRNFRRHNNLPKNCLQLYKIKIPYS